MKRFCFLLLSVALDSLALSPEEFRAFVRVDPRVSSELAGFVDDGVRLPRPYIQSFEALMLERIFNEKKAFTSRRLPCTPSTVVTFLTSTGIPLDADANGQTRASVADFESGIVRIESVGCLSGQVAGRALAISMKPSFQMKVVKELQESRLQGDLTCERTSVPLVGTSRYCYKSTTRQDSSDAYLFTQNVSNAPLAQAGAPVFYRTMLLSFHNRGDHTVSHLVAYVRGSKISPLLRGIARSTIQRTQGRSLRELQTALMEPMEPMELMQPEGNL